MTNDLNSLLKKNTSDLYNMQIAYKEYTWPKWHEKMIVLLDRMKPE